jgi:hypothetical protein
MVPAYPVALFSSGAADLPGPACVAAGRAFLIGKKKKHPHALHCLPHGRKADLHAAIDASR